MMIWTSALVADARAFGAAAPPILLGLVAVLVGPGSPTRRRLIELDLGRTIVSQSNPKWQKIASTPYVLTAWEVVESFALSFIRVLSVGFVLFVGAHAVRGEPPTPELLNQSLTRTIDLAVKLVGMLAP